MKHIGKIASKPELKDNDWHFQLWNEGTNQGWTCITNVMFRTKYGGKFPARLGNMVSVEVGHETHGVVFVEDIEILKPEPKTD